MLAFLRQIFSRALLVWINIVQGHKILTIIFCLIAVLVSIQYTRNNLGMNTDTEEMLSADLEWRKLDKEMSAEFPQLSGNILVVVEAPTPDQAMDAADILYVKLNQETTLPEGTLKSVFSFRSLPFFKKSSLLFLEEDELQDLSDRLAEIQPFLSKLTEDQNIRGLFIMLEARQARMAPPIRARSSTRGQPRARRFALRPRRGPAGASDGESRIRRGPNSE